MTASKHFIREVTTGTGTGNLTLAGAAAGFQSFGDAYGATTTDLLIQLYRPGGAWEVGLYTYNHGSRLIDRSSGFLTSSTGSKIDWTEGSTIVEPVVPPHDEDHDEVYLRLDASNDPVTGNLDVHGNFKVKGALDNANLDLETADGSRLYRQFISQASGAYFLRDDTAGTNPLIVEPGALSNSVYLRAGGNVGIGTFGASAKLHVAGTARVDSRLGVGGAPHASRALEVAGSANATGDLTEDGNRVIACETDGKFTVPLFSDALPRGFTQVTGWDGAAVRIEDTLVDAEDGDVSAGRKDIGAAAPTTEGHTLAASEMPIHTHSTPAHTHNMNHAAAPFGTSAPTSSAVRSLGGSSNPVATESGGAGTTGSAGGNNPHNHQVKLKYANFILAAFTGA